MPGYDGRGPSGEGAMTGGGRGYCAMPAGRVTVGQRIGRFFGRGGGRGQRNRYYATGLTGWQRSGFAPEEEKQALRSEAETLKQELADIQNRIDELEKNKTQNTDQ